MLNLFWQFSHAIGQIFIAVNGKTLKKESTHLATLLVPSVGTKTVVNLIRGVNTDFSANVKLSKLFLHF